MTIFMKLMETLGTSRRVVRELQSSYDGVEDLNFRRVTLSEGESVTFTADKLLILSPDNYYPVLATAIFYSYVDGEYVANDPVDIRLLSHMVFPSKISISIEKPNGSSSDMNWKFSAYSI
jgi:hypothetical protein